MAAQWVQKLERVWLASLLAQVSLALAKGQSLALLSVLQLVLLSESPLAAPLASHWVWLCSGDELV